MTFEQALIAALSTVTGALCFVARLLWTEAQECKADRSWLRTRVEKLEAEHGVAVGKVQIYESCHQQHCPFRPVAKRIAHMP